MAEAQRDWSSASRAVPPEQHEQPGRQPRPVGARLAVQQPRRAHMPERVVEPQDPVALRGAAAFQRRIDEIKAERPGGVAAQRIRAVTSPATQVDQRLQAVATGQRGKARRRRVVAAIQPTGGHGGKVAPDQAEHGVVDDQGVEPGKRAAAGGGDIASEYAVHRARELWTGDA
jgi:hypothetical protein